MKDKIKDLESVIDKKKAMNRKLWKFLVAKY